MEKILFVSDASSDLIRSYVKDRPIEILSATLCYAGQEKREFYDITPEEYWKVLESIDEVPVTQQVSPIQFLECYKNALEAGYTHLIVTLISSTASGNYNSAVVALDMFRSETEGSDRLHIELIDSRGYSMMYGHVILEGVRLYGEGIPAEEIVREMRDRAARTQALFMVYTLKHMKKSGRISGMSAFVGETLGIRPILKAFDGAIHPIDKVRGEKNLVPRMIELMGGFVHRPEEQVFQLVYADLPPEEIDRAEALLRENFHPKDIKRTPIGCSVTTNTGPYCLGVIYYTQKPDGISPEK